MNAQSLKHQLSLQKWTGIVKARSQSGLKVIDFCRQEGISKDAYYYWLSQIRKTAIESMQAEATDVAKLVKLVPPVPTTVGAISPVCSQTKDFRISSESSFVPQLTIQFGRVNVSVSEHTSKELLSSVMEVILHAQ